MSDDPYGKILALIRDAFALARSIGIDNLLQPGLVREMIIADVLGHEIIKDKRGADACLPGNAEILFEYLSCKEGGSGQLDRMFRTPAEKRAESLNRISRNSRIYLAIFHADNQIQIKTIYEFMPHILLREAERQLDASSNEISHIGVSENWAKENGTVVYSENGIRR